MKKHTSLSGLQIVPTHAHLALALRQLQTHVVQNLTMWTQNRQISHIVRQNQVFRLRVSGVGAKVRAKADTKDREGRVGQRLELGKDRDEDHFDILTYLTKIPG